MSYQTDTVSIESIETLYKSPDPHPNGLQATPQGLWCLDQHTNHLHLLDYATGNVLLDLTTASDRGSGVTDDGETLWLASTYNRTIYRIDRNSGATLAEYESPDPSQTGAHGLEWRDGKLWISNPPSATLYQVDPSANLTVIKRYAAPGNRPHGLGWHGNDLWLVETNHRAFYCYDPDSGAIRFKLQLPDGAPEPHGMTIWQGHFWYCEDKTQLICRLPVPSVS